MDLISTIILILALTLFLILILPFHISLNLQKTGGIFDGLVEVKWFKIRLLTKKFTDREHKDKEMKKKKSKEEKKSKARFSLKDIEKAVTLLIRSRNYLIRFLKISWDSFCLEFLKIHIILGFQSPADTATSLGYLWATAALVNLHPQIDFTAVPDFTRERLDGKLCSRFKIRLLKPFFALIWLLTKKPILSLLWNMRNLRK